MKWDEMLRLANESNMHNIFDMLNELIGEAKPGKERRYEDDKAAKTEIKVTSEGGCMIRNEEKRAAAKMLK